jgi:2-keto-4-pentenoate hydratase/2-oxohepta-3-ene-1,7-dioic acid hydratase in catechol pathway
MRSLKSCLLIIGFVLVIAGTARALSPEGSPTVIDWSKGAAQDTTASCGPFTFTHMEDRHSYSLYVRGKVSGTCSFHQEGLTFRFPSNHGATLAGTSTLYSFERFGADVLVAWIPGY